MCHNLSLSQKNNQTLKDQSSHFYPQTVVEKVLSLQLAQQIFKLCQNQGYCYNDINIFLTFYAKKPCMLLNLMS
jgi:hypothetical protein